MCDVPRIDLVALRHCCLLVTAVTGRGRANILRSRGMSDAPLAVPIDVLVRHDSDDTVRWLTVEVALAPRAPGEYAIEVAQGETERVMPFRIVP
jgi:hypothetical protein